VTDAQSLFLSALGLSIAFCAPPGVITAEAVRRGLVWGYRPVLRFELGAFVGGSAWAVGSLAGLAAVSDLVPVRLLLAAAGALVMLRMAVHALNGARCGGLPRTSSCPPGHDFRAGALLALANPSAVVFWLGAAGELGHVAGTGAQWTRWVIVLAGFCIGNLAYRGGLSALIAGGRRRVSATALRWVNGLSALLLVYFSVRLVASLSPLAAR
jgi:threonine/homoserine/homoserine lactone efflux protein